MESNYRWGDMPGLRGEIEKFIEFVTANEEMTTEKMVEYLSKRPIDLGAIYSKFMAACVVLWLAPDAVRGGELRPSPQSERSFDLLWLAFEQWLTRGISHYAEVAGELNNFYGNLRWMMIQNRNNKASIPKLDTVAAEAAHLYLTRVSKLATENFNTFMAEISRVLEKLNELQSAADIPSRTKAAGSPSPENAEREAGNPGTRASATRRAKLPSARNAGGAVPPAR